MRLGAAAGKRAVGAWHDERDRDDQSARQLYARLCRGPIEADVLILGGSEDHFIPASQAADFARALTAARRVCSIVYDRASGGAEHCQMEA